MSDLHIILYIFLFNFCDITRNLIGTNFLFLTEINELWFGKYCTYCTDDTRGWIVCGVPALGVWTDYLSSSEEPLGSSLLISSF